MSINTILTPEHIVIALGVLLLLSIIGSIISGAYKILKFIIFAAGIYVVLIVLKQLGIFDGTLLTHIKNLV